MKRLALMVLAALAVTLAACGGSPSGPTTFHESGVSEVPSSLPPLTMLDASFKSHFDTSFHASIFRPAVFNGCAGAQATSTAYLGSAGAGRIHLLTLYTSPDGRSVTQSTTQPVVKPAGTFKMMVVLYRHPATIDDSSLDKLQAAQQQINDDYAAFAAARGYAVPIVSFNNTNVVIDRAEVDDPHVGPSLTAAIIRHGYSLLGMDFLAVINIDPSLPEGGFASTGTAAPRGIYMGNFGAWTSLLTTADFVSIAGAIYHHEVPHHWGWPGTHDWATCRLDFGFNFRVPPILLGWEDVDGDGVPEILDSTPYGRSRR